jgi:hypothetical protein
LEMHAIGTLVTEVTSRLIADRISGLPDLSWQDQNDLDLGHVMYAALSHVQEKVRLNASAARIEKRYYNDAAPYLWACFAKYPCGDLACLYESFFGFVRWVAPDSDRALLRAFCDRAICQLDQVYESAKNGALAAQASREQSELESLPTFGMF